MNVGTESRIAIPTTSLTSRGSLIRRTPAVALIVVFSLASQACGYVVEVVRPANKPRLGRVAPKREILASPRNLGFEAQPVTHGLPQDWEPWGPHSTDYAYSLDQENKVSGTVSARIEFKAMSYRGQGGYVQCAEANDYAGKRLKLTGSHKTMNATQRKGVRVWLRAFGPENRYYYQGSSVGASDASDSILGTTIWATRSARIDVPHDAEAVCYGALLDGRGVMWVDDLRLVAEKVES